MRRGDLGAYVLRRVGQAAVVLWGAITLSVVIVQLTPGDPARLMIMGGQGGDAGAADESQLAGIRAEMGLDQPILQQYLGYLERVVTLDWGTAYSQQRQGVSAVIGSSIGSTLELGVVGLLIMIVLGVAFALGSVLLPAAWLRSAFQGLTVLGIAVPSFVMAIVLLQVFSFRLGWFPAFGADGLRAALLPAITIALLGAGTLGQVFARSIREVTSEGYVEVARARGLSPAQVVLRHVLRNASLPVYTIVGMLVGGVVSGAAIIETIFGRPGIGSLYVEAVSARDFPLIQALIVLTGGIYVLVTLLVDLSYPLIDPRVVSPSAPGEARPMTRAIRALAARPGAALSGLFLVLLLGWILVPGVFATHDPLEAVGGSLAPPSREFWFGTDLNGRDVYSRVVHGARSSLLAGIVAVVISLVVGGLLGMLAGYAGGILDAVISRTVEVIVSIPGLLLSLAIISALGFGVDKVAIAVGIAGIPGMVRIARAETLRIIGLSFMDAALTSGTRRLTRILTHVVPHASGAIAVVAGIDLGGAILSVASLSFLGFGAVPPDPEWGSQINEGRMYVANAWWWTAFPALLAGLTVLAVNRLSRGIGTKEDR